eukprot:scaffold113569_cov30-Cyclotella_meneghiniana.AAC.1
MILLGKTIPRRWWWCPSRIVGTGITCTGERMMTSSGQGGTSFENVSVASPNDDTSFGRASSSVASLAWGRWFAGTPLGMRRGSVPFCHGGIMRDQGSGTGRGVKATF